MRCGRRVELTDVYIVTMSQCAQCCARLSTRRGCALLETRADSLLNELLQIRLWCTYVEELKSGQRRHCTRAPLCHAVDLQQAVFAGSFEQGADISIQHALLAIRDMLRGCAGFCSSATTT